MPDATIIAYLAGMIDGDGYVSITRSSRRSSQGRHYFGAQVGIAGTRREPHDFAASIWGGAVTRYEPANPNHRPQFQWCRVGAAAVPVLDAIWPYLILKKDHALLALELQELVIESRSPDPFPWFGPGYDPLPIMHRMREQMVCMNQSRNRLRSRRQVAAPEAAQ